MTGRIGIVPRVAFELLFGLVDLGADRKGPGIERYRVIEHGQPGQVMNQADGGRVAIRRPMGPPFNGEKGRDNSRPRRTRGAGSYR